MRTQYGSLAVAYMQRKFTCLYGMMGVYENAKNTNRIAFHKETNKLTFFTAKPDLAMRAYTCKKTFRKNNCAKIRDEKLKTKKNSSGWDFWHFSKFVIRFLIVAMHDTHVVITDRKQFDKNLQEFWEREFFSVFVLFLGFMCVCSLQNVGRGYREENLCLSIGIVRDASPDSITDIKIRKSSQKAPC